MLKDAPDFKLSVSNASMHKRWGQIKYDLMSAAARQAAFHYQAGGVWWHCSNFQKVMSNPTAKNEEGKKTKPIFLGGLLYITISHRIHGAAIYGNIYHQDTPNVSIYTSTMDPMGMPLYHDSSHKCETDGLSMSPYVSNRRLRSCRTTETSTSWSLLLRAAWRSSRDGWWGSCMFMSSSWFLCKDGNNICS